MGCGVWGAGAISDFVTLGRFHIGTLSLVCDGPDCHPTSLACLVHRLWSRRGPEKPPGVEKVAKGLWQHFVQKRNSERDCAAQPLSLAQLSVDWKNLTVEETAALHDEWLRKQGGPHPLPHIPTPIAADASCPMTERMMSTIAHDLKAHEAAWIERTGKEESP